MSQNSKSVIDFFTPDGQLREEAGEFEGLDLEPFIDKRSKVTPAFSSALMGVMQFDLENGRGQLLPPASLHLRGDLLPQRHQDDPVQVSSAKEPHWVHP